MHIGTGATHGLGMCEVEVEGLLQVDGVERNAVRAAHDAWLTRPVLARSAELHIVMMR